MKKKTEISLDKIGVAIQLAGFELELLKQKLKNFKE